MVSRIQSKLYAHDSFADLRLGFELHHLNPWLFVRSINFLFTISGLVIMILNVVMCFCLGFNGILLWYYCSHMGRPSKGSCVRSIVQTIFHCHCSCYGFHLSWRKSLSWKVQNNYLQHCFYTRQFSFILASLLMCYS